MHEIRSAKIKLTIILMVFCFLGKAVEAHEVYVLAPEQVAHDYSLGGSYLSFQALTTPENLKTTVVIAIGIFIALALAFYIRKSKFGNRIHRRIERLAPYGPLAVRIVLSISLFLSATHLKFLGPELSLLQFPHAYIVQILLYILSITILFGIFTRISGLILLGLFFLAFHVYGIYFLTYFGYIGEALVLLIFGASLFSVDSLLTKWKKFVIFPKLLPYETSILRVFFGLGLLYAAINVKILHPYLTLDVVNLYHLTQYHWLFPRDPLLVVLGAGLVESLMALFIIFGFELRLTIAVFFFYMTLSLGFFGETVWPHLILYGIGLCLFVEPETFTLDHLLFEKNSWKQIFGRITKKSRFIS